MKYVWDENKEIINIRKHKLNFVQAAKALEDEFRLEEFDYIHSTFLEDRYNIICSINNEVVLAVTCIFINSELIRIISARKATRKEIEKYYDQDNIFRRS